jgi:hypothetical protein
LTDSAISAGPGNVKRKQSSQSTVVQWQVTTLRVSYNNNN